MRLLVVAAALSVSVALTGCDPGAPAGGDTPPIDVWNEKLAADLVGKTVLIGKTYVSAAGEERHEQFHGVVSKVDPARGVAVELAGLHDGETFWLPPDTRSFQVASPGSYRLRSTGEVIVDPDFLTTWMVQAPAV